MKKLNSILWGLFFIIAGALVIVNRMGYLAEVSILQLVYIIIATPIIIKSLFRLEWFGVLLPVAAGLIIFAEPLNITNLTPWPVLIAAVFTSLGLSMIFHKRHHFRGHHEENFAHLVNEPDDEYVSSSVNFSSSIKYVNSKNFKKGDFKCSFGAMKIYFDNTILAKEGAVIKLDISFGGMEIYIPKEWNVTINCDCSLGGIDEKNSNQGIEKSNSKLTIIGNVSLSGVEIVYV